MSFPRGRNLPISLPRRLMCDFLHFSKKVPLVCVERLMDLGPLCKARQAVTDRPSWFTLFLKAFGLAAHRWEALRTSYMSFPWPHLHVHEGSIGGLPIERRIGDEDGVLFLQIRKPDERPLAQMDALIRRAKTEPLENFGDFRRQLLIGKLPGPVLPAGLVGGPERLRQVPGPLLRHLRRDRRGQPRRRLGPLPDTADQHARLRRHTQ